MRGNDKRGSDMRGSDKRDMRVAPGITPVTTVVPKHQQPHPPLELHPKEGVELTSSRCDVVM